MEREFNNDHKKEINNFAYDKINDNLYDHFQESDRKIELELDVSSTVPITNKNCRKSRSTKGRGLPKKGGAGGKGTWGKLGEEINQTGIDKNDPNYDSESSDDVLTEVSIPELKPEELNLKVEPLIQEYFNHGNTQEVLDALTELNIPSDLRPGVAVIAINMALDRREASDRELISILLSETSHHNELGRRARTISLNDNYNTTTPHPRNHFVSIGSFEDVQSNGRAPVRHFNGFGGVIGGSALKVLNNPYVKRVRYLSSSSHSPIEDFYLTRKHFELAFEQIVKNLKDYACDVPAAPEMVGNFMARAIADDCFDFVAIDDLERKYAHTTKDGRNDNLVVGDHEEDENIDFIAIALQRARNLLKYPASSHDIVEAGSTLKRSGKRESRPRPINSLLHVWGITGSVLPIKTLRKTMDSLIHEFLDHQVEDHPHQYNLLTNNGAKEDKVMLRNGHSDHSVSPSEKCDNVYECASKNLRALNVPHFNHEYVFRAVLVVLEEGTKITATNIRNLLTYLVNVDGVLDNGAIEMGFERVVESLPELCLVHPNARPLLKKFIEMCCGMDEQAFGSSKFPYSINGIDKRAMGDGMHNVNVNSNGLVAQPNFAGKLVGDNGHGGILNGYCDINGVNHDNPYNNHQGMVNGNYCHIPRGGIKLADILIAKKLLFKSPAKGRKRFVSEGDGGLVKNDFQTGLQSCDFK